MRLAIEHHDEEDRKRLLVSAARAELHSKYQQAFTMQQRAVRNDPVGRHSEAARSTLQEEETSPVSTQVQESHTLDEQQKQFISIVAAVETMETVASGASLNSDGTIEGDLVEVLERIKLSETASTGFRSETKDPSKSTARDSDTLRKHVSKKPHYIAVLEKTEKISPSGKQKFKPNV